MTAPSPRAFVVASVFVVLSSGAATSSAATRLLCGDANADDTRNTTDALLILRAAVGQPVSIQCAPPAPVLQTGQDTCYDTDGEDLQCPASGQDGEILAGVGDPFRFATIDEGTMTDLLTSLQWEVLTDDDTIHDKDSQVNWGGAAVKVAVLNGQNFAGHNDWRLPNEFELQTIINYDRSFPALFQPAFDDNCTPGCTSATCRCVPVASGDTWSSTSSLFSPTRAWIVRTTTGVSFDIPKTNVGTARVVRGGRTDAAPANACADSNGSSGITSSDAQLVLRVAVGQEVELSCPTPVGVRKTGQTQCFNGNGEAISCTGTKHDGDTQRGIAPSFTDNGDGTITDNNTKLVWEKLSRDGSVHDQQFQYQWPGAFSNKIATLNNQNFAGHNDWRVPNVAELLSIVNLGATEPAIAAAFDSNCAMGCTNLQCSCPPLSNICWSSTTFANFFSEAWFVDFATGQADSIDKNEIHNVRAVRGGLL